MASTKLWTISNATVVYVAKVAMAWTESGAKAAEEKWAMNDGRGKQSQRQLCSNLDRTKTAISMGPKTCHLNEPKLDDKQAMKLCKESCRIPSTRVISM